MSNNHLDRIQLHPEPDGGYTVTVPSLLGCITFGDTILEARTNAKEAIELYLEELAERGELAHDESMNPLFPD